MSESYRCRSIVEDSDGNRFSCELAAGHPGTLHQVTIQWVSGSNDRETQIVHKTGEQQYRIANVEIVASDLEVVDR